VNLYRRVGCDCTLGAMMVQGLGQYPNLATGVGMTELHFVFENQFFVLAQDQPGAGTAAPVGAIGLDMKARFAQPAYASIGLVFQARTRDLQFQLIVLVAEAGGKISQGIVEPGVRCGEVRC